LPKVFFKKPWVGQQNDENRGKKEIKMPTISLLEMLKSGVHFGHQKQRWHPKMKQFIYTTRSGVHIIDLEKTSEKLQEACDFITEIVQKGGKILFVATKRQAQNMVKKIAIDLRMPYVSEHWIGGCLTNFETITKLPGRLKELRKNREKGELEKYTKLERLKFDKEITELEKMVGGIESMTSLPQAVFIIDLKTEKTAVSEARKKKIPIIAIVDTNCNPDLIDYPVPGNDDAIKSLQLITGLVAQAIKEGQAEALSGKVKEEVK